jgi:WD40 repeat protein
VNQIIAKALLATALLLLATMSVVTAAESPAAASARIPSYDRDVAPILRTWCAGCHNDAEREGEWSVERFASLRQGGAEGIDPIVPGDAAASLVIRRIESTDGDHMPPAEAPQPPAADVELLRAWIAVGAPGPETDSSILCTLAVPAITPHGGPRPVTAVAAGPGDSVAVATGRVVRVHAGDALEEDATGGGVTWTTPPLVEIADLPGEATAVHFSGDRRRLVIATGIAGLLGEAQLRDAATGGLVASFGTRATGDAPTSTRHRDLLYDAELSPDGSLLATAGYDRLLAVWRVADGSLLWSNTVHNGAIFDIAWHPSGRLLATASADETVKLWKADDGGRLDTLGQPQGEVTAVAFTPDGRHVVAAGRDRRIHLWSLRSLDTPAINPLVHARFAHEAAIVAVAVSADGRRLLSSAEDGSLAVWTLPDLVLAGTGILSAGARGGFDPAGSRPDVAVAVAALPARFLVGRMDGSLELIDPALFATAAAAEAVAATPAPAGNDSGVGTAAGATAEISEQEPNDDAAAAMAVTVPARIRGDIGQPGDVDCFRFSAQAGEPLVLEIDAARSTSKLDSKIEILHADGRPVERVVLQATRESWFTFRGKDSTQPSDFRIHNWAEMELDEYLYAGGEVVKLWHYPRGPDSGFIVYPGFGPRHTFFGTTPVAHALGEPAWIVEPLAAGSQPLPNGLPVFRLVWENDDEPTRRLGTDSQLVFEPPADGEYVVRVSDVRGFGATAADVDSGGEQPSFHYALAIRPPQPSFQVSIGGKSPKVSPGSGRELAFTLERLEGFAGPVRIDVANVPPGFTFHGPLEIAAGQRRALGVLSAAADAPPPDESAAKAVRVTATGLVGSAEVVQEVGDLGTITLGDPPKITIVIFATGDDPTPGPGDESASGTAASAARAERPPVFEIRPGETIRARVRAVRHDFPGRIELGRDDDAGRNLPHGVYVDNVGLNGLLIVEDQTEREFFLTASPITRPGRRLFHLKATPDGGQTSLPVWLDVVALPDPPPP